MNRCSICEPPRGWKGADRLLSLLSLLKVEAASLEAAAIDVISETAVILGSLANGRWGMGGRTADLIQSAR